MGVAEGEVRRGWLSGVPFRDGIGIGGNYIPMGCYARFEIAI